MATQHGFKVARVDVEAAADDHVLAPVVQGQETVFVEAADIAGADVAPAFGVEPLGCSAQFGLAVVAGHHAGRTAHHFTAFAWRHLGAVFVDQADVVPFGRLPHRVQLGRKQMRLQDAGAAAFGQAVVLHQCTGPARHHVGLQVSKERRAGAELEAERREVEAVEFRVRHQAPVLQRHQHGVRGTVHLRQLQILQRVELRHQHDAAAVRKGGDHADERGVAVQRRGDQRHRVKAITRQRRSLDVRPAHGVRLHDAFGRAGGARRVDEVEGPGRVDGHRRRAAADVPLGQQPGFEGATVQAQRLRARRPRHLLCGAGSVEEDDARVCVFHHRGQLRSGAAGRQRCHGQASTQGAQEQCDVVDRRRGADRQCVAGLEAVVLQRGGNAVCTFVQPAVAE